MVVEQTMLFATYLPKCLLLPISPCQRPECQALERTARPVGEARNRSLLELGAGSLAEVHTGMLV
eukprot:15451994-Alexandrium_andersonii.AAC.1